MYGLKPRHYAGFAEGAVPHPHEYFVPMSALTDENSEKDPALQALVARTTAAAQFLTTP
jgi:hypothetical protein